MYYDYSNIYFLCSNIYSLINMYCQELFVPHCGNMSTGHFGLSGNIQES